MYENKMVESYIFTISSSNYIFSPMHFYYIRLPFTYFQEFDYVLKCRLGIYIPIEMI